eukprot:TRINITY_DN25003_c0_g1_i1.p1 TRINITY_DN25003_c0_g1~~TRINITY_DN25003_c0_g1_i1.p1  ORF type:complete len:103 (-),score=41.51 TRINITY_DN25003_c0_g1_i1:114-422(-)
MLRSLVGSEMCIRDRHKTVADAAQAHGAAYDDLKNLLKKWRKEGSLDSHVVAYRDRQPAVEEKKVAADRKAVLTAAVKAMKAGQMSVREVVTECKQNGAHAD